MSVLDLNLVNNFVLRKQHLTDESKTDDVVQIVNDIGGLHATSPKTPYLSMFSRAKNFTRKKLDEELYEKRSLGKIRCVRKTVYVLPKDMIPVAYSATTKMVELTSERYSRYLIVGFVLNPSDEEAIASSSTGNTSPKSPKSTRTPKSRSSREPAGVTFKG